MPDRAQVCWTIPLIIIPKDFWQNSDLLQNKGIVRLGSCNNVQTERSIFEYAKASNKENWSVQLVHSAGPFSWSVQLVRPAGLSSWSVQLVRPAGPTCRPIYTLHLTHSILHNAPCTLLLKHCI